MFQDIDGFFHNPWTQQITFAIAIAFIAYFVLQAMKSILQRRFIGSSKHPRAPWTDDLIRGIRWPLRSIMSYFAIAAALQAAPLITQHVPTLATIAKVIWVLLSFWLLDRIAVIVVKHSKLPASFTSNTRTLLITVHRIVFAAIALLIILDTLGISITPILASLGVGSLAVALALQDTLNNFFSGIYILMDRPVRVGDYVRIDGGPEGYIRRIGWRTTQISVPGDNIAVLPNTKLSSAFVTNFDMPVSQTSVTVSLGVAYDSDLEKVERITLEVAQDIMKHTLGGVPSHEPTVRFHTFGDSSIDFNVGLKANRYDDSAVVKHAFIKALHARYAKEGIDIPFPQRVVHDAK